MFYALAEGKIDTGELSYVHELSDIESLNQRARRAELEVTAVSIHAYAYIWREYALLGSGSSMGDGYGPRLVSNGFRARRPPRGAPGAANRCPRPAHDRVSRAQALPARLHEVVMPFDRIEDAVHAGEVDVGLLIHEGSSPTPTGASPLGRHRRLVAARIPGSRCRWAATWCGGTWREVIEQIGAGPPRQHRLRAWSIALPRWPTQADTTGGSARSGPTPSWGCT